MPFAALPGTHIHGARFLAQALERGAKAVLTIRGISKRARIEPAGCACYAIVQDPHAVPPACALWFENSLNHGGD